MKVLRKPIRVVIVVQEGLYRDLLNVALSRYRGLEVVGVFADAESALASAPTLAPEVAVLDLEVGKMNGIQLAVKLRRLLPEMGVVLLSNSRDHGFLASLPSDLLRGWSYLINKSAHNMSALGRAIQITAAQLLDLDGNGATQTEEPTRGDLASKLTERQVEILDLVSQGLTNAAVATTLQLKEKTIENQLASIYEKLDIERRRTASHPRVKAVLYYLQTKAG